MKLNSKYAYPLRSPTRSSSSTFDSATITPKSISRNTSSEAGDIPSLAVDSGESKSRPRTHLARSTTVEAIIEMYGERPLPPIPRAPSSIYPNSKRNTINPDASPISIGSPVTPVSPRPLASPSSATSVKTCFSATTDLKSARHLSQLYRKGNKRKSVKERAEPETQVLNLQTAQAQFKALPKKPVPFTEWRAPTYQEPNTSSTAPVYTPTSQISSNLSTPGSSNISPRIAEGAYEHATDYFGVLHPSKSTALEGSTYDFAPTYAKSPSHLTTTKDLRREASLPHLISTDVRVEKPPRSRFSPCSPSASDVEKLAGVASSLRTRAKKAFLHSKPIGRPSLKDRSGSNHSEASHKSSMPAPPPDKGGLGTAKSTASDDTDQAPSEVYSGHNQLSQSKQQLPTKDLHDSAMLLAKYQKYGRQAFNQPKTTPYVHRLPRKRLSKPQVSIPSSTVSTRKAPDTTYKIEMPVPPTPKRPRSTLLFDHTYHLELVSPPTVPSLTRSSSIVLPTRTNTIKTTHHRLSHSATGSSNSHGDRCSKCLPSSSSSNSTAKPPRTGRYSLPLATHTWLDSQDSILSRFLGHELARKIPTPQLARKDHPLPGGALTVLDSRRKGGQSRKEQEKERMRYGSASHAQATSERRREELKKSIVVIGDPNAVGVPF